MSTLAGGGSGQGALDGEGKDAQFYSPGALVIDEDNTIYMVERDAYTIRKIVLE